jgi:hypothetical protein
MPDFLTRRHGTWQFVLYCGPVLRHPAEFMLPAVVTGPRRRAIVFGGVSLRER